MMITDRSLMLRAATILAAILVGMAGHTGKAYAFSDEACVESCFVLTSLNIQGVTAYPLADLAPTYDHNLARLIGVADLVQTADAITDHYRRDGYFLTRAVVAPGDHPAGSASIVVYEGYIGDIVVEGSGAAAVAPLLSPLTQRRALTIGELDRRLARASDVPGIRMTSRIEPILDDPAQHRLIVTANLDRFSGGVFAENRGSEAQGPWQVYATVAVNSVAARSDRMTVAALVVPDRPQELTFGEWTYSAPLGGGATIKAAVSGYTTDAPSTSTSWLSGESQAAAVSVTQPLIRARDASLWAAAGLDVRQVEQTYVAAGTLKETLTVARVTLSGRGKAGKGHVSATGQVAHGLDAFGATTEASPQLTRPDATGRFTKLNLTLSGYQDVGRFAGLYGEVAAQWSGDPLLASEEFYIGGPAVGRGYNYGELSGDSGLAGVVELRVGWDPKPTAISFFQLYGFVDAGRVVNHTPTGRTHADLASAGLGARITVDQRATFRVEFAKPLSRTPATQPDKGWRVFIALSREF